MNFNRVDHQRARLPQGLPLQLLKAGVLSAALLGLQAANAADAVHGKALYTGASPMACSTCHGTDVTKNQNKILNGKTPSVIQSAINQGTGGMNMYAAMSAADVADIAAYIANPSGASPVATIAVTPASVSFASQAVSTSSAAQTVTVKNSGTAALTLTGITLAGSNPGDFTQGGTCAVATPVAAGSNCSLTLGFLPTATGSRSATVTLVSNASNGNATINVSGTATAAPAAMAAISPTSVSFGSALVGSATTTQTVTITNSGTAALSLSALSTSSTDFKIKGGTCSAAATVAVGGNCTVLVDFEPQAAGARSATLTIAHNAAGSPGTVALSGTGTAATPAAQLSPASLTFSQTVGSTTAAQTVTLSNPGTAALTVSSVSLTGAAAADYAIATGTTCTAGSSVAVNGSCVVKLSFKPSTTGARAASLNVAHNAAGSPSSVTLNGTGTAVPQAVLSVNQNALSFAAQALGTSSAAQSVTLTNSGNATLSLNGLTIGGGNATDFVLGGACTVGNSIAAGSSCTATVSFAPQAIGARSGTLNISTNASNPAVAINLSGTGAAAPAPAVSFNPSALDLGSSLVGQASPSKTLTLTNSGTAALSLSSISASPSAFAVNNSCPATLAPNASCTVTVGFTPSATGAATGTLTVMDSAAGSPHSVALSGTGAVAQVPVAAFNPAVNKLGFADTSVGNAAATQTVSLVNQGPGVLTVAQVQKAGANAADFNVVSSTCAPNTALQVGASCALSVNFQPAAAGDRAASITVQHNGTGSSSLALAGRGVAVAGAAIGVSPSSLSLVGKALSWLYVPQSLVLRNDGTGSLRVTEVIATKPIVVLNRRQPEGGSCAKPPFDLAAGASCTLKVSAWLSYTALSGSISIVHSGSTAPIVVPVTGNPKPPVPNCGGLANKQLQHECEERRVRSAGERDD